MRPRKVRFLAILFCAFEKAIADVQVPGTQKAAIMAGMGNDHGLEILSEPEAAALYTIKHADRTLSRVKASHHHSKRAERQTLRSLRNLFVMPYNFPNSPPGQ
jgi:hypothetical protein